MFNSRDRAWGRRLWVGQGVSADLQPLVVLIQALSSTVCSHSVAIRDIPRAFSCAWTDRVWSVLWEPSLLLQRCHPAQKGIDLIAVLLQLFGSFHLKAQGLQIRLTQFLHVQQTAARGRETKISRRRKKKKPNRGVSQPQQMPETPPDPLWLSGSCRKAVKNLSLAATLYFSSSYNPKGLGCD